MRNNKIKMEVKRNNPLLLLSMLVIFLFVNLPLASALNISGISAEPSETSAVISWTTDEPADSFTHYGETKEKLTSTGDASLVTTHTLPISNLKPETEYIYKVESNNVVDDKSGEMYSFKTLAPDTTPPILEVNASSVIQGTKATISGKSESGSTISISVSGIDIKTTTTDNEGKFTADITLAPDIITEFLITAKDSSGNKATKLIQIQSDTKKPTITLATIPKLIEEKQFTLKGTISENSTIEINQNNKSIFTGKGDIIENSITLEEGINTIIISAVDAAGWSTTNIITLTSDTLAPQVKFTISGGNEYYEFQASSKVIGDTEPGAGVYLYVFIPQTIEYGLNFKRAIAKTTADSIGKFEFEDVDFSGVGTLTLKDLSPTKVPPGLEGIILPKIDRVTQTQRMNYQVYVLAEDKTGKVGHAMQTVFVNSCSSGDYAFDVYVPPEFPVQPLKLNPLLMKEGRESMSVVYNLTYRGTAISTVNSINGELEIPYKIQNVRFEKACTSANVNKDDFNIGCKLVPRLLNGKAIKKDNTMYFLETPLLRTTEFSEITDDALTEFTKRQLKVPLKITVNYQERDYDGTWKSKTQVECREIGSFVDIPIDSSLLVPDSLAEFTVSATNTTLTQIARVKRVLEPVMKIAGITCYSSWLLKGMLKINRVVTSWYETFTQRGSKDKPACPTPTQQREMYLKSTIDEWKTLKSTYSGIGSTGIPDFASMSPADLKKKTLDEACPSTANAWSAEATFDKLYKSACDRFFCRSSPARWTEDKPEEEIKKVVLDQQQCASTSNCITMTPVENCQNELKRNPAAGDIVRVRQEQGSFTCWKDREGTLYYHCTENDLDPECKSKAESLDKKGVWILKPALSLGISKPKVLALKGDLNSPACVAQDRTCKSVCSQKPGYVPVSTGYKQSGSKYVTAGSCYKENNDGKLSGQSGQPTHATAFTAGYTRDCFIEEDTGDKYQCVCEQDQDLLKKQTKRGSREALPKTGEVAEPWIYRQQKVYEESGGSIGTYYPDFRYYDGRDFTAAFGLNHITDFVGKPKEAKIRPTEYIGAWQTMCLPQINNQLTVAESWLTQLQSCVIQAQTSEFQDAGICKTFFATNVCGWIYKGISSFTNQCSPFTFDDVEGLKDPTEGTTSSLFKALRQGIPEALQGSANELKNDYGVYAEQQFKAGTQGVAQSMCLFAFGYDFPTDFDFLTDAAYATPMKTSISPLIANREFTSFDPIRGVPEFTYNLGVALVPGCPLRGYKSSLKCIGPGDLGRAGIDPSCDGQGCDCLQVTQLNSPFEGEKARVIPSGTTNGQFPQFKIIDIPYQNPLQVESQFRYDHVKLELYLEPGVDPEKCFDEEVATKVGGEVYFPLSHVEGTKIAQCQVHVESGRYICPALTSLLQQGGAYLEHPFVRCYDKDTDEFVDCQQPNTILVNQEIVIKPYISSVQSDSCLVISDTKGNMLHNILLPQSPVPVAPRLSLGTANLQMISGGQVGTIRKIDSQSAPGCGVNGGQVNQIEYSTQGTQSVTLPFSFTKVGDGYQIQIPTSVSLVPGEKLFGLDNNRYIQQGGSITLSDVVINEAIFTIDGHRFSGVLGTPQDQNGNCVYKTAPSFGGLGTGVGTGTYNIKVELKEPGVGNNCWTATKLVDKNPLGKNVHPQSIRIQTTKIEDQQVITLHDDFMNKNYHLVISKAQEILKQKENNINNALAIYYWSASLVMQSIGNNYAQISSLIDLFAKNEYPTTLTNYDEYKKIKTYLCVMDEKVGSTHSEFCKGTGAGTVTSPVTIPTATLCGQPTGLHPGFIKPTGWENYECKPSTATGCLSYTKYVPTGVSGKGCSGEELCCPK